jgi:hypothetical protein
VGQGVAENHQRDEEIEDAFEQPSRQLRRKGDVFL